MKDAVIDLALDEPRRWAAVISRDRRAARRVAREALDSLPGAARPLGTVFRAAYAATGGRWVGEMDSWADALCVSRGETVMLQCSYELGHLADLVSSWRGRIFGCTAAAGWAPGLGMVHLRSLDWPLESIGGATRLFRFQHGRRRFVSVGIAGFVGVPSGMLPGRYSVTLNWAPPVEQPGFGFGPSFLIREVLEEIDDYDDAVHTLQHTPLATSAFFVVCGTKPGQACVIERTRTQGALRRKARGWLVQANHHVLRRFVGGNAAFESLERDLEDSRDRQSTLEQRLESRVTSRTLAEVARALDAAPVRAEDTHQQMVFCPRTGQVRFWAR